MESCCGFCFAIGLSRCCEISGCWLAKPVPPDVQEMQTQALAIAMCPLSLRDVVPQPHFDTTEEESYK